MYASALMAFLHHLAAFSLVGALTALELTAILGILLCAPFMARGIGLLR
jgi:uncharacterized membrane protein